MEKGSLRIRSKVPHPCDLGSIGTEGSRHLKVFATSLFDARDGGDRRTGTNSSGLRLADTCRIRLPTQLRGTENPTPRMMGAAKVNPPIGDLWGATNKFKKAIHSVLPSTVHHVSFSRRSLSNRRALY
jgi:hypothetical protein